jgi:hypothetical protein
MKRDIETVHVEIMDICQLHPGMPERLKALEAAGYKPTFKYIKKSNGGYCSINKMQNSVRIQISHAELKKTYPAAWCIDIPMDEVQYNIVLPF